MVYGTNYIFVNVISIHGLGVCLMEIDMKELTIYRDKWCRNRNFDEMGLSQLLNESDNMCCLGFLGKACGISNGAFGTIN